MSIIEFVLDFVIPIALGTYVAVNPARVFGERMVEGEEGEEGWGTLIRIGAAAVVVVFGLRRVRPSSDPALRLILRFV